jgi:hypothetical protein
MASRVQFAGGTGVTSATFGSATTTGNKVIVLVFAYGNNIATVTDNKSNTYTKRAEAQLNATKVAIYEGPDSPTMGASHTVSMTAPGAGDTGLIPIEVNGLTTTPFDTSANNHVTASPLAIGPTATLAQANEYVVGLTCVDSGDTTITPPAGTSQIAEAENGSTALCFNAWDLTVSATTALTETWTFGTISGADGVIATFKAAGGGAPTGTVAVTLDPFTSTASGTVPPILIAQGVVTVPPAAVISTY